MKISKPFISTLAAGALALGITGVLVANSAQPAAVAADGNDPVMTQAISPRFSDAQGSTDALPAFLVSGSQEMPGVVPDSTRLLGQRNGANFWLATNDVGETCLISLQPGADQLASMTCQPAKAVWEHGLALQVVTQTMAVRAYFLPAGYSASITGYEPVGDQLLVGQPQGATESIAVPPASGVKQLRSTGGDGFGTATLELPWMPAPEVGAFK